MNWIDFVLLAVLAVIVFLALRKTIRSRGKCSCSGCSGNCATCGSDCPSRKKAQKR